jgi:flagellin
MTSLMQRGREFAVQAANATNSDSDKAALQHEIDQIKQEITRITGDSAFNGIKIFQPPSATGGSESLTDVEKRIITDLKTSWLQQSEAVIDEYFGLSANGQVTLDIRLDADIAGASAYVSFFDAPTNTMELHIDVGEFEALYDASAPNYVFDQLIAHEMTHAVMAATTNLDAFPAWFIEGAAEFLPGGDDRLSSVLGSYTAQNVADNIDNFDTPGESFGGSNLDYATAYTATRYLDSLVTGGLKEVMTYLSDDPTRTMDDYFAQAGLAGITSSSDFATDFKANGAAFIGGFDLGNNDTGGIGGADANGGTRDTTREGTIPDTQNLTDNPLTGFIEIYPQNEIVLSSSTLTFQVGGNVGETIDVDLYSLSLSDLGLEDVDISTLANDAITAFDAALEQVNSLRSTWGAVQNRIESALNVTATSAENLSASRSRIQDADFASETAKLTRTQILQQAATSVLAQSNALPQNVLSLLG